MPEVILFEPMGLTRFIADGIRRYLTENDGLRPLLLILSPAQCDELQRGPQWWWRLAAKMGEIPGIATSGECTVPYLLGENFRRYEL